MVKDLCELISAGIMSTVFNNVITEARINETYMFLGGAISMLIMLILTESIIRFRSRSKSKLLIVAKSWSLIITIPLLSLVLVILTTYNAILDNEAGSVPILSCIIILYVNIITFYLFDNIAKQISDNNKLRLKEQFQDLKSQQYQAVIDGYEAVKKVRHDILGHLVTLQGYNEKQDFEKTANYLVKLNKELDIKNKGVLTGNVVIDAIINNRKNLIRQLKIDFREELQVPIELNIDDMDLSIILGNMLNNAIEACERNPDKDNEIHVIIKYFNDSLVINLKNTYNSTSITKNGKTFTTSKPIRANESHGMGLKNTMEIIRKYDGVLRLQEEEKYFNVDLIIPDKTIK